MYDDCSIMDHQQQQTAEKKERKMILLYYIQYSSNLGLSSNGKNFKSIIHIVSRLYVYVLPAAAADGDTRLLSYNEQHFSPAIDSYVCSVHFRYTMT